MEREDFVYLDIPVSLTRKFSILTDDGFVADTESPLRLRRLYEALTRFLYGNGLLRKPSDIESWETWVLMLSDFSEEGQRFIVADYPGKWMAAHDRNLNRDVTDVRYMEMRLRQMRSS